MAHKVSRLEKKKVYNTPHLITSTGLEEVVSYLDERPNGMMSKEELAVARDLYREKKKNNLGEKSVAVIPVSGVLTYEETLFGALCGMSSYQGIIGMMHQAVSEGYQTVVLDVDSGGGEAYGTFETSKELRRLATENNIKLIAYVDGISASAAYGLSVAADEIILNPYAEVGSIGVVTKLMNNNEKMKKEGISQTYVFAGDNKIPFDSEGEWREDFIAEIQDRVDTLYEDFTVHVAGMRNIDVQAVKDTQAKMFSSDNAITLGLADKIMERQEFANYLADLDEGKDMPLNLFNKEKKEEKMSTENLNTPAPEVEMEAQNQAKLLADLQEQVATLKADKEKAEASLKAEAQASFAKELADFSFVGDDSAKLAASLFNLSTEDKEVVMAVLAKADKAVTEMATNSLAIEEEDTPELETETVKQRAALRQEIEARNKK
jgi:signal peptide peptidase SppA